jgi:hypothetical protein
MDDVSMSMSPDIEDDVLDTIEVVIDMAIEAVLVAMIIALVPISISIFFCAGAFHSLTLETAWKEKTVESNDAR